jgi:hypothetical protein
MRVGMERVSMRGRSMMSCGRGLAPPSARTSRADVPIDEADNVMAHDDYARAESTFALVVGFLILFTSA